MINRERTIEEFGYDPDKWGPTSKKKVWVICEDCGEERILSKGDYKKLCKRCSCTGERNSFYGKHHTPETNEINRDAHLGKKVPSNTGENSWRWNDKLTDKERVGNRDYPEYEEWRKAVYKRDDFTCQVCKKRGGGVLNAHHLDSYATNPESRTTLENGETLCKYCHDIFHHIYGYDNTKEQFIEFKARRCKT